jgi:D-hydroxyproline dehydrogenase subunit alpha
MREVDVLVVGGGPAGMSAARAAAERGAEVALVDGAPRLGGQYYRQLPAEMDAQRPGDLHHEWEAGRRLIAEADADPRIAVLPATRVWRLEQDDDGRFRAFLTGEGEATAVLSAAATVLAPGAHERTLPFPGWELPGVMTPGAAQVLVKGSQVLPGRRVLVAGSGPFLLAVAALLVEAGSEVVAVLEARRDVALAWARRPSALVAAAATGKLSEGFGYLRTLRRAGVPMRAGWGVVAAHAGADGAVATASIARLDRGWSERAGTRRELAADAVCVGHGFVPSLELAMELGCRTVVDAADGQPVIEVDATGASSVAGVFVAGEATGIGGAALARLEGEVAGSRAAAHRRRGPVGPAGTSPGFDWRRRAQASFARTLRAVHRVPLGWAAATPDETIVCRCEEVSAGAIRESVRELGATDARSVKLLCRAGMGLCQGRMCASNTAALAAEALGQAGADPVGLIARPLAEPVSLDQLASGD